MAAEDRADTFDDLKYYTEQIAPALDAGGIKLLATNAETVYVALPNHTRRAVLLSGLDYPYGYLLIDPGGPERDLTPCRRTLTLPTCCSPAVMCCCTTASGESNGRMSPCGTEGFTRSA